MQGLDAALLSSFLCVVRTGKISAAARRLHLSQPAVTAQIKKLEAALGVALFVRSSQGVTPTAAGERLVEFAQRMERLLEEAGQEVGAVEEPGGKLEIAASTTIAAHVLPGLWARYAARYPGARLRVRVDNSAAVIAAVRDGVVPLGLVEGHARAAGVRLAAFLDDEIVPVLGPTERWQVRVLDDLRQVPILWREPGSGTRAVLERALRAAGLCRGPREIDIELGSTEAILSGANAGLGVGFVSRWSLEPHLAARRLSILAGLDFPVRRTFRWALPAGALQGAALRFFTFAERSPPVLGTA
jgi:DNA-binding transcriptional LysR family regulator